MDQRLNEGVRVRLAIGTPNEHPPPLAQRDARHVNGRRNDGQAQRWLALKQGAPKLANVGRGFVEYDCHGELVAHDCARGLAIPEAPRGQRNAGRRPQRAPPAGRRRFPMRGSPAGALGARRLGVLGAELAVSFWRRALRGDASGMGHAEKFYCLT